MKKLKYIFIGLLVLIISRWIIIALDNWMRTPTRLAERISGLELPKDLKIISYKDEWKSFNGDGETEFQIY